MMDDGDCAGWKVFKHYYSIKVCGCGHVICSWKSHDLRSNITVVVCHMA